MGPPSLVTVLGMSLIHHHPVQYCTDLTYSIRTVSFRNLTVAGSRFNSSQHDQVGTSPDRLSEERFASLPLIRTNPSFWTTSLLVSRLLLDLGPWSGCRLRISGKDRKSTIGSHAGQLFRGSLA